MWIMIVEQMDYKTLLVTEKAYGPYKDSMEAEKHWEHYKEQNSKDKTMASVTILPIEPYFPKELKG